MKRKLILRTETLLRLSGHQLRDARGGWITGDLSSMLSDCCPTSGSGVPCTQEATGCNTHEYSTCFPE